MVAGTAILILLLTLVWHFRQDGSPAQELQLKANRLDLVGQMQVALESAAAAEKSAVLAVTDQESQAFADQAREATRALERDRSELEKDLATRGTATERDLLRQFSEAFGKLQQVDEEVLALAVKNTNLKAFALAFGPTAEAVQEFDGALAGVARKGLGTPGSERIQALTFAARLGLVRIQALLPPHIAEESDAKMDQLEASMTREERSVREALAGLEALPALKGSPELAAAASSLARFIELKVQILALSRENTNVRSLALSLNQKRKALLVSLDSLGALRQAILDEPIAGMTSGRPIRPR
jgi:hypothetical protein